MSAPKDQFSENYYAEDWWLEFLEGELDPSFEQDLAQLMINSEADRSTLQGLAMTRELVKLADPVALTEDGRYYDQLHARIMKEVRVVEQSSISEEKIESGAAAEAEVREALREKWMSY